MATPPALPNGVNSTAAPNDPSRLPPHLGRSIFPTLPPLPKLNAASLTTQALLNKPHALPVTIGDSTQESGSSPPKLPASARVAPPSLNSPKLDILPSLKAQFPPKITPASFAVFGAPPCLGMSRWDRIAILFPDTSHSGQSVVMRTDAEFKTAADQLYREGVLMRHRAGNDRLNAVCDRIIANKERQPPRLQR